MKIIWLYIQHCLLFRSNQPLDKILGVFGWLSFALLGYAIVQIVKSS